MLVRMRPPSAISSAACIHVRTTSSGSANNGLVPLARFSAHRAISTESRTVVPPSRSANLGVSVGYYDTGYGVPHRPGAGHDITGEGGRVATDHVNAEDLLGRAQPPVDPELVPDPQQLRGDSDDRRVDLQVAPGRDLLEGGTPTPEVCSGTTSDLRPSAPQERRNTTHHHPAVAGIWMVCPVKSSRTPHPDVDPFWNPRVRPDAT